MTQGNGTRLIIIAAVAAAIAAAALLVRRAGDEPIPTAIPRKPFSEDRAARAPRVCLPLADSRELILLVHRSRGRYCMW